MPLKLQGFHENHTATKRYFLQHSGPHSHFGKFIFGVTLRRLAMADFSKNVLMPLS
jgi:hypothetical protein